MPTVKQQLHALCLISIEERIMGAHQAIQFAQSAANEETKSSAGDKYETGRAMAQLEIEKTSSQLDEAQRLRQELLHIDPTRVAKTVQVGSLVVTNHGRFYVSIPAGQFTIEKEIYFAVSPASPIAKKMLRQTAGATIVFNNLEYLIQSVS